VPGRSLDLAGERLFQLGVHQDYWETSGRSDPYCMAVIPPKLQKLRKSFAARSRAVTA